MSDLFIHDGTGAARLAPILNLGCLTDLPGSSAVPPALRTADWKKPTSEVLALLTQAGFVGIQGPAEAAATLRAAGMILTCAGRILDPAAMLPEARKWRDLGAQGATLHLGTGMESESEADRLCAAVVEASASTGLPIFVETHRATLTQDYWRTVQLVQRHPGLRVNADYSHWYTGLEMVYGDWQAKLAFLAPVFARVGHCHGRIGTPGTMQMSFTGREDQKWVGHFRELWTASFRAFRAKAGPGAVLPFAPELLQPAIHYARLVPGPEGQPREEGDRWSEAVRMAQIAKECWAAA